MLPARGTRAPRIPSARPRHRSARPDRGETIFPTGLALVLLVPIHALLGPVLALITVIGAMGNGPLAAVLWENGVLFAGIMAFLYSDFVVIPSTARR